MSSLGGNDKTSLSPWETGKKGKRKSSRKTNGRFTESDQLFPFDDETLVNPRLRFDKKGKLWFNTIGQPSCSSWERPPP